MHTMDLLIVSFIACVAAFALDGGNAATFDVMNYGAVGDGEHDDTKAFEEAWKAVCEHGGVMSILKVPKGRNFLLSPVKFEGPCKSSSVRVMVLGNIVAPKNIGAWKGCACDSWLYFSGINGLIMHGSGQINGNGESWWKNDGSLDTQTNENNGACNRPTALHFFQCDGLQLKGLKHINSPRNHISIVHSNHVNVSSLHILAPEDSPNTDGIDVSSSSHVSISKSNIQTGDDCVAINNGSSDITVTGVSCGPGHGISVGSLGADGSYASVEKVFVKYCNFHGAQNGVRIKTWPGGSGYARVIHFENITLTDVENPIIIDQFYCNGEFHCGDQPSAVEVSHVTYRGLKGTSINKQAIQLGCSKSKPCTSINMQEIYITSAVPGVKTYASCNNALGTSFLTTPNVPCLSDTRFLRT